MLNKLKFNVYLCVLVFCLISPERNPPAVCQKKKISLFFSQIFYFFSKNTATISNAIFFLLNDRVIIQEEILEIQ